MKNLLLIISIICLVCEGCMADNKDSKIPCSTNVSISGSEVTELIIGEWGIYATISVDTTHENGMTTVETTETLCNGCPIMRFDKGGTGIVKKNLPKESSFNWVINEDTIFFSFNSEIDKKKFIDIINEFIFVLYREQDSYVLELKVPKYNYEYILRRSIKLK